MLLICWQQRTFVPFSDRSTDLHLFLLKNHYQKDHCQESHYQNYHLFHHYHQEQLDKHEERKENKPKPNTNILNSMSATNINTHTKECIFL